MEARSFFGRRQILRINMSAVLEKIRKYCAYQDRCLKEVDAKLRTLGCDAEKRCEILQQLVAERFIDEDRYVESFVRGKINAKGWGLKKIVFALKQKGIEDSKIQKIVAQVDGNLLQQNLQNLIKKWLKSRKLDYGTKPQLYRYLMGRGYSSAEIADALKQMDINSNYDDNF